MATGGGSMYLNDALGRHEKLRRGQHEQVCAMAADSYYRLRGKTACFDRKLKIFCYQLGCDFDLSSLFDKVDVIEDNEQIDSPGKLKIVDVRKQIRLHYRNFQAFYLHHV